MKKLIYLLLFIPFISFAQYGESRYVEIGVVDQYGNSIGTLSMMARHVDTYSNGYEVAVDRYIQYLEEKETRERAERQRNALNQRLRSLGISEVPSWDTGIYSAAMEGYASGVERGNSSYGSNRNSSYRKRYKGISKRKLKRLRKKDILYQPIDESIKENLGFFHFKKPDVLADDFGFYQKDSVTIEFLNNQLYNEVFRKVKINNNIGYVNINSIE